MGYDNLNVVSDQEAVSHVNSGNRVFIQGAAMTPNIFNRSALQTE